jgi:hypothetical protein
MMQLFQLLEEANEFPWLFLQRKVLKNEIWTTKTIDPFAHHGYSVCQIIYRVENNATA